MPDVLYEVSDRVARLTPPPFLDLVTAADPATVTYQAWQSEEGGRFDHQRTRHLIVDVTGRPTGPLPDNYLWVTAGQAERLLSLRHQLNIEARSLLTCLRAAA